MQVIKKQKKETIESLIVGVVIKKIKCRLELIQALKWGATPQCNRCSNFIYYNTLWITNQELWITL